MLVIIEGRVRDYDPLVLAGNHLLYHSRRGQQELLSENEEGLRRVASGHCTCRSYHKTWGVRNR